MKKSLLSAAFLGLVFTQAIAQQGTCTSQLTVKPGSCPSCVAVYLKPDFTDASVLLSNLTFTLSITNNGTTPNVANITGFIPSVTFDPADIAVSTDPNPGGRVYFDFSGNDNGNTTGTAFTNGTEIEVLEVQFNNGVGSSSVQLNDFLNGASCNSIPSGGFTGLSTIYVSVQGAGCDFSGTITSTSGSGLFYSDAGVSTTGSTCSGDAEFAETIDPVLLPVTISTFSAQNVNNNATLLTWNVEQENALATYEIEHGTDGVHFDRSVGIVAVANTHQYSLKDNAPVVGDNYYRLKVTGKDGKTFFTIIRKVWFDASDRIVVGPTLTNDMVNVILPERYQGATIEVVNAVGQKVAAKVEGTTKRTVSLGGLAAGSYILRVQAGNHVESHKIQLTN